MLHTNIASGEEGKKLKKDHGSKKAFARPNLP
jgi:hypothetical protein